MLNKTGNTPEIHCNKIPRQNDAFKYISSRFVIFGFMRARSDFILIFSILELWKRRAFYKSISPRRKHASFKPRVTARDGLRRKLDGAIENLHSCDFDAGKVFISLIIRQTQYRFMRVPLRWVPSEMHDFEEAHELPKCTHVK